jgi:hypothetical protein
LAQPGRSSSPGIKARIERLLGVRISRWDRDPDEGNGVFYMGLASGRRRETPGVHVDHPHDDITAVVYLTPGLPEDCGTSRWKHRATGLTDAPTAADARRGEELGGLRAVKHSLQRTAPQGSPTMPAAVTGEYVRGAQVQEEALHPFRKWFDDLAIGDSLLTHRRTVTDADIVSFGGISGDFFYMRPRRRRSVSASRTATSCCRPRQACSSRARAHGVRQQAVAAQPWYCTTVLVVLISSRASRPFSRPWPLRLVPPKGNSTPPPAP